MLSADARLPATVTVDVDADTPMERVKIQLHRATGLPIPQQHVMLGGIGEPAWQWQWQWQAGQMRTRLHAHAHAGTARTQSIHAGVRGMSWRDAPRRGGSAAPAAAARHAQVSLEPSLAGAPAQCVVWCGGVAQETWCCLTSGEGGVWALEAS